MERLKNSFMLNKFSLIKNFLIVFLFLIGLMFNMDGVKAYSRDTVFEGVGHYDFATASAPLSRRFNDLFTTVENHDNPDVNHVNMLIRPEENSNLNLDDFRTGISNIGIDYNSVNNLSGSKLILPDNAKIKKAYLSVMYMGHGNSFDALVAYPEGNFYKKYTAKNISEQITVDTPIDLTEDLKNISNPSGYYFVSILNNNQPYFAQHAWSLTVVYEDANAPITYTKLININASLCNNPNDITCERRGITVYTNSPFKLLNNFSLMGVVKGAGVYGFANYDPNYHNYQTTNDKAWACVKKDGVTYTEDDCPEEARINLATMNGHFDQRLEDDFIKNVYNKANMTVKDTDNMPLGGEIDVFNEKITKADLGNQELIGFAMRKDGTNAYNPQLLGISAEVEAPNIEVTADIEEENGVTSNTVTFENISEYDGCNPNLVIPIDSKLENVRDVTLSSTNGVSYNIQDGKIVVSFTRKLAAGEKITVTYKADRKKENNVIMSGKIYLKPVGSVYPSSEGVCSENENYKITATDTDESSAYTLIVNHFKNNTTEPVVPNSTTTTVKMAGSRYETSALSELPDGYVLVGTPSNHEGTMNSDVIVNYYYKLKDVNITVHHYKDGTTEKLAEDESYTKTYGEAYNTSPSSNVSSNYELVAVPSNANGTATENVTVTYYYKPKIANIIVHHYKDGTTEKLAEDVTFTKEYGQEYTTDVSNSVPRNYIFKARTNNYSGIADRNPIIVDYFYQKKDSNINPSIVKEGTDKITSSNQKVNYSITYNANFTDYIGDAVVTITDQLPYKIDPNNSNLNGGTYDDNTKTITWVENISVNSYESNTYSVTKNIEVLYKDIDLTNRIMTNEVIGRITGDGKDITVNQNHNTEVEIIGNIIVKYIDKDTGEDIADRIETSGHVGETFDSSEKEIIGYKLVEKPTNEHFTYREGTQTVEYKYERIKFKVETKVNGEGGTIEGDEEVFYGEDSTKDKIKINAADGYQIDKLTINGSEVEIPNNSEILILSNFPHMTENKLVEVSFEKKPTVVKVPKTSSFIIIPIVIGLIALGAAAFVIKNKTMINFDFFKKN